MESHKQSSIIAAVIVGTVLLISGCSSTGAAPHPPRSTDSPIATKPSTGLSADSQVGGAIEPVLVVAGVDVNGEHVTASGYVSGVVADGGTCVFMFKNPANTTSVTVDNTGNADRMTTSCGMVQVPIARFDRGSWSVTLGYTSGNRVVESAPLTVEIP
ncbi:MAG: hypothetical protein EPN48_00465 [Microbacteriaceae bacterium]|nr:MAG: hypothetical protein EPN48_00465 [Microbacteriaceae bacterium]